jgi:hypothetical protein
MKRQPMVLPFLFRFFPSPLEGREEKSASQTIPLSAGMTVIFLRVFAPPREMAFWLRHSVPRNDEASSPVEETAGDSLLRRIA